MKSIWVDPFNDHLPRVFLGILFIFSGFSIAFDAIPLQISYRIIEFERATVGLIFIGLGLWLSIQTRPDNFLGVLFGIAAFWAVTQMSGTNPGGNLWDFGFPLKFYSTGGVVGLCFKPKPFFTDLCFFIVLGVPFWHSFRKTTSSLA